MTVGLAAAGRAKNAGEKERKPEEAFEKQPEERQAAAVFPEVRGFGCDAGRNYALQEITSPKRIVTTTVAVRGREDLLVPVRTSEAVDKSDVNKVLALCSRLSVRLPVTAGSIVREDVCGRGSGVDLVCCVDRTEPQTPAGSGVGRMEPQMSAKSDASRGAKLWEAQKPDGVAEKERPDGVAEAERPDDLTVDERLDEPVKAEEPEAEQRRLEGRRRS